MDDVEKSREELLREVGELRQRLAAYERPLAVGDGEGLPPSLLTGAGEEARRAGSAHRPARILATCGPALEPDIRALCGDLGHELTWLDSPDQMTDLEGHFDLLLLQDDREIETPFPRHWWSEHVHAGQPRFSATRGLFLGIYDPSWGLQDSYLLLCSGYCQLQFDAGRLSPPCLDAFVESLDDALHMPPLEHVDFYHTISLDNIKSVVESSQAPLLIASPEGRFLFANLAAQAMFKRPTHLFKDLPVDELLAGEDARIAFWETVDEASRSRGQKRQLRMKDRRGREFFAEIVLNRVWDPVLPPDSIGFTVHDISPLKKAEADLRASRQRLRSVVGSLPVIVYSAEALTNRMLLIEGAVRELLGCDAEDLLRDADLGARIVHEEDREWTARFWQEGLAGGKPFELEFRVRRANDGEVLWVHARVVPILDSQGRLVRQDGIVVDVSESKRAAREREQLEAQVRHAQKLESLGVLAGGIAHDFNNLLVGVLGNAGLILDEVAENARLRECARQIEKSALRASELTRQMLAYAGKGRFVVENLEISQLIREMMTLLESSISKKAVLRFELESPLPETRADSSQLRQLVVNLVTNASESLGGDVGIIILRTGRVAVDEEYLNRKALLREEAVPGEFVFIEVADTGCGMGEEMINRVFDPFFSTKFTGRGLGLPAVLGIVRGHQGALEVETATDHGTRIRALFPIAPPAAERAPAAVSGVAAAWRGEGTILIVDDEESVLNLGRRVLEPRGFRVLTAVDGREGIEVFRKFQEDIVLVLLDLTMPILGGEEALREIRSLRGEIPVILSSGYSEEEVSRRFTMNDVTHFLQKPYLPSVLADRIRRILQHAP